MVYEWKKTLKKGIYIGLEIAIAGMISVYAGNNYIMLAVPAFEMLRNAIKHWNK